jgi:hypothetical protein
MQLSTVFVALAAVSSSLATPAQLSKRNHQFTFTNNCAQTVTPMLTSTGGPFIRLAALGKGGSASTSLPENVRTTSRESSSDININRAVAVRSCVWPDRSVQSARRRWVHPARVRLLDYQLPPVQPLACFGLQHSDGLLLRRWVLRRQPMLGTKLRQLGCVLDPDEWWSVDSPVQHSERRHAVSNTYCCAHFGVRMC